MRFLLPLIFLLISLQSSQVMASEATDISLNELSWIDKKYFDKQRQLVDDLGRENFGTRLRQDKTDIELIQRLLDNQLVTVYDVEKHKALGIALGDIYVKEQGWAWNDYKDKQGRSHGVCVPKTQQCVFPLSMLTRRLRVTTEHNVARIYQRGLDLMADAVPPLPYSAPKEPPQKAESDNNKRSIVVPFL